MSLVLPEFIGRFVEIMLDQYCDEKVPELAKVQVQLNYVIDGTNITLYERCHSYLDLDKWATLPVAQFRYDVKSAKWTLYRADRDARWHLSLEPPPNSDFDLLLEEVDKWLTIPTADSVGPLG